VAAPSFFPRRMPASISKVPLPANVKSIVGHRLPCSASWKSLARALRRLPKASTTVLARGAERLRSAGHQDLVAIRRQ
jgi:hypothetical protein